jgi:hypothetical protein
VALFALDLFCPHHSRTDRSGPPSHGVFPVKLIHLRRPLACHPRSGAGRGGAEQSRERSDLDAPAGRIHCHERARPCALLAASAVFAALLHFGIAHLLLRLDPKREPVICHAALTAASPHIRSSLSGSDHNPSCSRASGSGWRGPSFFTACFSPGSSAVAARPDPAKPSRSASLDGLSHQAIVGALGWD